MADETKLWEYRVLTIGSMFGTKDENIEATLNGAKKVGKLSMYKNSGKVTIVAKRPLTRTARRQRSMI